MYLISKKDFFFCGLSILSFIGVIIGGYYGSKERATFCLIGLLILIIILLICEILRLRKKISEIENKKFESPDRVEYLNRQLLITAKKNNSHKINCDFVSWEKGTVMVWGYVDPKGEGIRKQYNNYILSHCSKAEKIIDGWLYYNRLSIGYHLKGEVWAIDLSSNIPTNKTSLNIKDGLGTGWHHFLFSWDREKLNIQFMIDLGESGMDNSFSKEYFWPEKKANNAIIGTFMEYGVHYCDTKLFDFVLIKDTLDQNSEMAKEHFKNKPS